jgi:hypothetical protein
MGLEYVVAEALRRIKKAMESKGSSGQSDFTPPGKRGPATDVKQVGALVVRYQAHQSRQSAPLP